MSSPTLEPTVNLRDKAPGGRLVGDASVLVLADVPGKVAVDALWDGSSRTASTPLDSSWAARILIIAIRTSQFEGPDFTVLQRRLPMTSFA